MAWALKKFNLDKRMTMAMEVGATQLGMPYVFSKLGAPFMRRDTGKLRFLYVCEARLCEAPRAQGNGHVTRDMTFLWAAKAEYCRPQRWRY